MTDMVTPYHRNPCPGVTKFTILEEASMLIITIYSVCLFDTREYRRFFKNNAFLLFDQYGQALTQ